ncbi:MAG: DNA polymerase III subunit beta, partial [Planctomycetota bacterium]
MKITCERDKLQAAFQTAASVAPSRSPKPILQNVKLTAEDKGSEGIATLMATDTEVGIRLDVAGIEVSSPGSVILPVSRFGPILRETTDEKLTIETDGTAIHVTGQRSKFKLAAENPDEFPEVATFDESKYHELPARLVKELIKRTLFATDNESSRYALGGVLLVFDDSNVIAVGTDGRRLAKMEGAGIAVKGHSSGEATTIVPSRAMNLIDRALSDGDAEIKIAARANDMLLSTPRATIYARLVEGRFPKWQDVVADRPDSKEISLPVGPFYSALRQAAIVTSDESRGVDFKFADGTLTMSGSTAEVGESTIDVPVTYDGDE